ncbi:aldehyde dehydrogenase family protein [Streptomyces collinus]|uniref:aldehyde dehydrogenase family protein n=1 Tax=Streptomyces collinus TaxID=42684 RepID=UPI00365A2F3C
MISSQACRPGTGGKSAAIVLPDAAIEKAVAGLKFGSLLNNGESCIARTRITGGPRIPEGLEKGDYVASTVFADVDNSMRIAQEEIFGPVLVVIAYDDEGDTVRVANDSEYGLSGGVWSRRRGPCPGGRPQGPQRNRHGQRCADCFDGPFGGFKARGVGREYGAVGLGSTPSTRPSPADARALTSPV